MRTIKVDLDASSVSAAIDQLNDYANSLQSKATELCQRLAEIGAVKVSLGFSRAAYTGPKDISVTAEPYKNGYVIIASGETVAFVEFGAGATYGYGHPKAAEMGMGPGTYPPTNPKHPHWNDPSGWYLPKDKGGGHTYGNPPAMPMYETAQELAGQITRIAREVFSS